ncbi:hypothetical protein LJB97_03770 [Parabacteroides sp. OttesenSCG-928-O15]|nr:hypothetical protein [Parabacteroides sp. OttesenSCG-928-O15]
MRNFLFNSFFLLLLFCLSSCMGESGDRMGYFRYGVVTTEPSLSLSTSDGKEIRQISFPELNGSQAGDCFLVEFKADFSQSAKSGVYDVEMSSLEPVRQHLLEETEAVLPDTIPSANEQFLTLNMSKGRFLKGRFFVHIDLKEHREEQTEAFTLAFNRDSVFRETEETGRYYQFCLRVIREGGVDSLKSTQTEIHALNLSSFLKEAALIEQEAGKDSLFFRFQYANRVQVVDGDSILNWSSTALYGIPLSEID